MQWLTFPSLRPPTFYPRYTQMRMFIGQRGNNASKPCPPPSSKGGAPTKTVGSKAGGGIGIGSSNRQTRRKSDDFKPDATKQPQCCETASPPPAAAPAVATTATSPAPASSSTILPADAGSEAVAKAVDDSAFDDKEEDQARADAVAALGMLFSQGNGAAAAR